MIKLWSKHPSKPSSLSSVFSQKRKSFMMVNMSTEICRTLTVLHSSLILHPPVANWIFKWLVFDHSPHTYNWLWFSLSLSVFLFPFLPLSLCLTSKLNESRIGKKIKRAVSIATLAMICTKDKWQVFKGLQAVLMFSLCFLSSTEKFSGDGRKTAMKGKWQRQTEGEAEGARVIETRPWWSMHVLLSVLFLCPQGRRKRRGEKEKERWCIWTVFRPPTPHTTSWRET